jgi:hypothetical protein
MIYKLSRMAPGSYDVLLNGVIIASLVRSGRNRQRDLDSRALAGSASRGTALLPSPRQSTRSAA